MWKEKILSLLEFEMNTPKPYGVFHLSCLIISLIIIIYLFCTKQKHSEKRLKSILGIYAITALILEVLKQFIWSAEYKGSLNAFVWDYQWYAFPFQLCTMPIYICLIAMCLKKCKLRDSLLSFVAFTTILGSIASAVFPDSLFVPDVLVNVHTMWLHLGSLVCSVYIITSGEIKLNMQVFWRGILVFLVVGVLAQTLNICVYNSGVLQGETFNMFYISPYFESSLPVFSSIYNQVPYLVFLLIYIIAIILGSYIVFVLSKLLALKSAKNP